MRIVSLSIIFPISFAIGSCTQESKEKSPEQIWKDASGSIVYVTARGVDGKVAQGSGFFVTLEGRRLILTNRHVVQGAEEVSIAPQGKNPQHAAAYKISPELDLAVIESPSNLAVRPLALSKQPVQPGVEVFALGFPLGIANVISRGMVGAVEDEYFLFDAPISSGNSGGPVVNRRGEVIGVATMGSRAQDGNVVQNLNLGIRVHAIPRLELFTDPLLRINSISNRIREVARFIAAGFDKHDFLSLGEILVQRWRLDSMPELLRIAEKEKENAREADQIRLHSEALKEELDHKQKAWEREHGNTTEGVHAWIKFLKECERQIDNIPQLFTGLGNDPLLTEFLKDQRNFKIVPVNATPELLPQLARIGADHWLAEFEDLRYPLEWLVQYSRLPPPSEIAVWDDSKPESKMERAEIRLKPAISGNREKDLQQYNQSILKWKDRRDVRDNVSNQLSSAYASTLLGNSASRKAQPMRDAIAAETLHGDILGQVSSMWQHLAIAAGDRGDIESAIRLVRRDLDGKSPTHWAGAMLAKYLVFAGRFADAWGAYRDYLLGEPAFDAFALRQGRGEMALMNAWYDIGVEIPIPDRQKFPEVARHVAEWNATLNTIQGRDLRSLGRLAETLSSAWFKELDDFSKLRVLLYYRFIRPKERDNWISADEWKEFDTALEISDGAETLWKRATTDRKVDFAL